MPPRADSILRAFVAAGPIVRLDVQQRRVRVWCGGPMTTEYAETSWIAHTATCPYYLVYAWCEAHPVRAQPCKARAVRVTPLHTGDTQDAPPS